MARRKRKSRKRSGINIKAKNKGAYTKQSGGKITAKKIASDLKSKNPKTRARANFARMARRGFKPFGGGSSSRRSSSATRSRGKTHRVRSHTRITATGRRVRVKAHRRTKSR